MSNHFHNPLPPSQVFVVHLLAPRLLIFYPAILAFWSLGYVFSGWLLASVQIIGLAAAFGFTSLLTDVRLTRRLRGRALLDPSAVRRFLRRAWNTSAPEDLWTNLVPLAVVGGAILFLYGLSRSPIGTFFLTDLILWAALSWRGGYSTFLEVVYADYLVEDEPVRIERSQEDKKKSILEDRNSARRDVEQYYARHSAVLREELSPRKFREWLEDAIPDDALPDEAQEGAKDLMARMKPLLLRGQQRHARLRTRLKTLEKEIAKLNRDRSKRRTVNQNKIKELNEERQVILTILSPTGVTS